MFLDEVFFLRLSHDPMTPDPAFSVPVLTVDGRSSNMDTALTKLI